ncbi:MAG: dihydrolipoyl dehydrogenase [Myxococcales bacterium]|nr:dihydrolipoyl dehydrogenase [Myxococcales bacterium]
MAKSYDVVVIGGGPGGYSCAIRCAQLKLKTLCVEKDELGGVCLNWGCIPSKALISAAHTWHNFHTAGDMGIIVGAKPTLDAPKMQAWKNGIVKKLTGGVRGLLKGNGAEIAAGTAVITGKNTVEITDREGKKETVEAKNIIVATGSTTIEIPTFKFDGKTIIGAKEAVSLDAIPKRLLVIGGGVIGLELGCVYQSFGAELTVVEATPTLLPGTDPDCVAVLERRMTKRGAKIFKSAKAMGYERTATGISVKLDVGGGKTESVETDVVLVAVGMRPHSKGLGLETIGVKIDERGFVPTDTYCRTNVPNVYAIGDVSGAPLLAHKAVKEGVIAAEVVAGHKAAKDWVAIPGAIFTDPEIAAVGMTEEQAKAKGITVKVGKMPFAASGRAMAVRETDGFVKTVTDAKTGQVLGMHIVGPSASDLISEGSLALEMAAFAEDIALTIHPHPTLGEAVMISAEHALGHAIDIMNK